jgi:hypothetical protein
MYQELPKQISSVLLWYSYSLFQASVSFNYFFTPYLQMCNVLVWVVGTPTWPVATMPYSSSLHSLLQKQPFSCKHIDSHSLITPTTLLAEE